MLANEQVVDVLKSIIETTRDAQNWFNQCNETCTSYDLKTLFLLSAERCQVGIEALERLVRKYGGTTANEQLILENLDPRLMELYIGLASGDDAMVLQQCERWESFVLKNYQEALKQDCPKDVSALLSKQCLGIQVFYNKIKLLRGLMV